MYRKEKIMQKFYIPFGDWSDDGHGKYINILVQAPSMEHLLEVQNRIKNIYGKDFFEGFAQDYEENLFSEKIWQALVDCNMPLDYLVDEYNISGYETLEDFLKVRPNPEVYIDTTINAFLWLMNSHGASITRETDYPMICNWTCPGFETVGYGCFE